MYTRTFCSILLKTFLFAIFQLNYLLSFNLETRLPIIKQGPDGSYFGYSVAEHVIVRPGRNESVLLIGAPKALVGRSNSGAVYKCALSTLRKDCVQLPVDQDIIVQDKVIKDDQWLGVTVTSQGPGGYVMACAHRFILAGEDYQWGQGICYSLEQDLQFGRAWEPCRNRPVNKAHEQYGFCQAGTSAEITKDNSAVIGAPGPYTWRGTVFKTSVTFGFRDDKRWYFGPLMEEESPVDKYSYLGMSVTSGIFFGNQMSYVGGAPRSNGTGQVVFFTKQNTVKFEVQLILDGEQFASSFGYSLASLDANQDGFLDLVVGAPFYYDKGKGGAVYIYMNSADGIQRDAVPIKMIGKYESRYGFALENAGDLNQDGYPDLVVGAPYSEEGGTVFVYLGSADGLITTPSQVIHASDVPEVVGLTTFGYSLDGGADLDKNSYPDLLIGAYANDSVVLLLSRPVLDIITSVRGELSKIDPDKNGCEDDKASQNVCFSFEACFQFNSTLTQTSAVKLKYKIEAETFIPGKKFYRVHFQSSLDDEYPNIVQKEIILKGLSVRKEYCSKEVVYLKDKRDIQSAVQFKLSYTLIQKDPVYPFPSASIPNVNDYPILNQQEASKIFEAKFLKDCGPDEICRSDLDVVVDINLNRDDQGNPVLFLGEKQVTLSAKVTNIGDPAYDAMLYVMHPASLSYIGYKVVIGDQILCVPFGDTIVSCELGNPLKQAEVELQIRFNPREITDGEKILKLAVKVNTTSEELTPKDDVELNIGIVKVAELEIRGISTPEQIFYGGEVDKVPHYEDEIGSEVFHVYEVINHGPWLATDVQMIVSWPYEASGYEHGKWLLYITETPEVIGNGYCGLNRSQLNPLDLKRHPQELRAASEGYIYRQRKKRAVEPQELRADGKTLSVVTLDCETHTARCFQFTCNFKSLERGSTAYVKIRSRLWNSTLVNDYPNVDWVSIISRAHILIGPDDIRQKDDNDFAFAETKAYPDILLYQKTEGVPLWIIILAACAGILLLIVLIVILWRCGFFERKKPGYEPAPSSDKDFM